MTEERLTDSAGIEWTLRGAENDATRPEDASTDAPADQRSSPRAHGARIGAQQRRFKRPRTDDAGRPTSAYVTSVRGFWLAEFAQLAAYPKFREALAELVEQSNANLSRFLSDVRHAALSSVLAAECPSCGTWSYPTGGRLIGRGLSMDCSYRCACGDFRARHDLTTVRWPDHGEPHSIQDQRGTREPRRGPALRAERARGTTPNR